VHELPDHPEVGVMMKDLLRTADLHRDDVLELLDLAAAYKREPMQHRKTLRGQTVVLYFAKPSTRTRLSFESAVARLGGTPVVVGPSELQLGRGETIEDTARVISAYAAAFVIRTFADDQVRTFATNATIPVVNALTDGHHPCQSLADLLTIREHLGHFAGRKLAYLGDGGNVAHSLLEAAALMGLDIAVATPSAYAPSPEVVQRANALAEHSRARIEVTTDPHLAVKNADVVYTDVWLSMGDADSERADRERAFAPYRVTRELLAEALPEALFMHCLPAHRGDEVTSEVFDGPRSVVFDQAANRLPTAQAVLRELVKGHLKGVLGPEPEVIEAPFEDGSC
jgi:ornithine carbamoyltransferase